MGELIISQCGEIDDNADSFYRVHLNFVKSIKNRAL